MKKKQRMNEYEPPRVEIIEVEVEQGFGSSSVESENDISGMPVVPW